MNDDALPPIRSKQRAVTSGNNKLAEGAGIWYNLARQDKGVSQKW